jgi:uncharacterized protein
LKAIVDTNVLVFDTFEDSEFHKEASSGLDSLEGWGLPSMVFHELVRFFKDQQIAVSRADAKVKEYLTNEKTTFIPCSVDDVIFASSKMKNHREYNDLVILSAAGRTGLPLYSFDEDLRASARRHGIKLFEGKAS